MTDKTPEDEAFDELEKRIHRTLSIPTLTNAIDEFKRNEVLEEVAHHLEQKFTAPFGEDTIASFAAYIRGMKR